MRSCCAALLLAPLLILFVEGQTTRLGVNLGSNEAARKVALSQGKVDAVAVDGDGRPATAVGPNGLVLTTTAAISQETELLVRFRITLRAATRLVCLWPARRATPAGGARRLTHAGRRSP